MWTHLKTEFPETSRNHLQDTTSFHHKSTSTYFQHGRMECGAQNLHYECLLSIISDCERVLHGSSHCHGMAKEAFTNLLVR